MPRGDRRVDQETTCGSRPVGRRKRIAAALHDDPELKRAKELEEQVSRDVGVLGCAAHDTHHLCSLGPAGRLSSGFSLSLLLQKLRETEELAQKVRSGSEERRAMFAAWNAAGGAAAAQGGSLPPPPQ